MADERDECFIPADKDDFKTLMNGIALTEHINKLKEFGSGSEVTDKQFTLLRTYFPRRKAKEICEQDLAELFGANKNYLDEADALLDKSPAFQNFLNKVGKEVHTDRCKEGYPEWSSQFTTALRWLKKILTKPKQTDPPSTQEQQHAPARASRRHKINYAENDSDEDFLFEMSKKPKKKDSSVEPEPMAQNEAIHPPVPEESVVNSFCVDFLMELGALIPACRSTWDIEHVNLKAKFNNGNYVARTDGCLKTETNGLIQAIVEVNLESDQPFWHRSKSRKLRKFPPGFTMTIKSSPICKAGE